MADTTNPDANVTEAAAAAQPDDDEPENAAEGAVDEDSVESEGDGTGNDDDAVDKETEVDPVSSMDVADDSANKDGDDSDDDEEESAEAPADDGKKALQPGEGSPDGELKSDGKKRPIEETKSADDEPLPTLPLKRARTAYFIFADEKREEVKKQHQGEGVAGIAKAIGHLWSSLQPSDKEVYEKQAAEERARVARDTQRLKDAGMLPDPNAVEGAAGGGGQDDDALIFPIGRIRKICKLDPDVKGMSKESALLITKATEMFCTKLGKECVTMAQMQNRRKLLPDDVVEVCSIKEAFMFLRADLVDLRKAQIDEAQKEKDNPKGGKGAAKAGEDSSTANTLDSYFGKVRQTW